MEYVADEDPMDSGGPMVILMHPRAKTDNQDMNRTASSHVIVSSLDPAGSVVTFVEEDESLPEIQPSLSLENPRQTLPEHMLSDESLCEQTLTVSAAEEEALSSLLSSVSMNADGLGSEQRVALFQADDGQIVCLTYTMEGEGEEMHGRVVDFAANEIRVMDETTTLHSQPHDSGTRDSSPDLTALPEDIVWMDGGATTMTDEVLSKLRLEERLRVLEQLLPPTTRIRPLKPTPPPTALTRPTGSQARVLLPRASSAPLPTLAPAPAPSPAPATVPGSDRSPRPVNRGGGCGESGGNCRTDGSGGGVGGESGKNKALYACDLCGACFERPAQFYGHLHRHSGERKFTCTLCANLGGGTPEEFDTAAALRAHERSHHPLKRPHACPLCNERFDRASQLLYHTRRVHIGERPHRCALCTKAFFKRSDLRTHLNVHLGIHSCVCETCGRRFGHVSNLIRHARTHAGSRPYPCPVCGRRFAQINAAAHHRASAHPEHRDDNPTVGDATEAEGVVLVKGMAPRVACAVPECARNFRTFNVMRKHARSAHGVLVPTVAQRRRQALQDAMATDPLSVQMPVQRKRRFHCAACGAAFTQAAQLREHERAHEVAAGSEGLRCSGCARRCTSVEELRQHACAPPHEPQMNHFPPPPPPPPLTPVPLLAPATALSPALPLAANDSLRILQAPEEVMNLREAIEAETRATIFVEQRATEGQLTLDDSHHLLESLLMESSQNQSSPKLQAQDTIQSSIQTSIESKEGEIIHSRRQISTEPSVQLSVGSLTEPTPLHSTTSAIQPSAHFTVTLNQASQQQQTRPSVPAGAVGSGLSDAQGIVVILTTTADVEGVDHGKKNAVPLLLIRPRSDTSVALPTSTTALPSSSPLTFTAPDSKSIPNIPTKFVPKIPPKTLLKMPPLQSLASGPSSKCPAATLQGNVRPRPCTSSRSHSTPVTSSHSPSPSPSPSSLPLSLPSPSPLSLPSPLPLPLPSPSLSPSPSPSPSSSPSSPSSPSQSPPPPTRLQPQPQPQPPSQTPGPLPPPPPLKKLPAPSTAVAVSESSSPQTRSFVCGMCGKVFRKSNNFKQHMGLHFVEQMRHTCSVCGRMFAWKSTLNKHMARAHGVGRPPRARCGRCGREYSSAAQVAEHERRDHELLRPHACLTPGCTRRFYKKHDLKVHQRMHSQERPYICGSCGKSFYHLSHIIRHERIHSGLRPYSCNECGRQFHQSSTLKSHKKVHLEKKRKQQDLQREPENHKQQEVPSNTEQILGYSSSLNDHPIIGKQQNITSLDERSLEVSPCKKALDAPLEETELEIICLEERKLQLVPIEERVLQGPSLGEQGSEVTQLEPLHIEIEESNALGASKECDSHLPSPPLNRQTPPEPLVELIVSDTDMVLGLPPNIFPPGLFPDVT